MITSNVFRGSIPVFQAVSRVSLSPPPPPSDHTALQGRVSRAKGKTGQTICFGLYWFHNRPLCCRARPRSCDAASLLSINTLFAPDLDELCKTCIPRWQSRKTRAGPSLKLNLSSNLCFFIFSLCFDGSENVVCNQVNVENI